MVLLRLADVGKTFVHGSQRTGLHRIDLDVEQGEMVSLLGPSGCGKTTTLRCIAGLERPSHGRIELDGTTLFALAPGQRRPLDVAPERRGIGMVFQDYALWPHMDVFRNVAFGLEGIHRSRADVAEQVEEALRLVRLWDQRDKRISQISGGQQQRVALARALAPKPKLVLFDEPLSNLDTQLREDLRAEILDLHRRLGLTSVWVTHDQEEALGMSDRVVVMSEGRVEQFGTPTELWSNPSTRFVAGFLGTTNRLAGLCVEVDGGARAISVDGGPKLEIASEVPLAVGQRVTAFVRASAIALASHAPGDLRNVVPVQVVSQSFHGDYSTAVVRLGNFDIRVRTDEVISPGPGKAFAIFDSSKMMLFPEE